MALRFFSIRFLYCLSLYLLFVILTSAICLKLEAEHLRERERERESTLLTSPFDCFQLMMSLAGRSQAIAFAFTRSGLVGRDFPLYLGQMWTDPNQTWQEETTSQREPIEKFGHRSHAWRTFLSAYMSPARLTPYGRKRPPISASNHVILLLIYAHR